MPELDRTLRLRNATDKTVLSLSVDGAAANVMAFAGTPAPVNGRRCWLCPIVNGERSTAAIDGRLPAGSILRHDGQDFELAVDVVWPGPAIPVTVIPDYVSPARHDYTDLRIGFERDADMRPLINQARLLPGAIDDIPGDAQSETLLNVLRSCFRWQTTDFPTERGANSTVQTLEVLDGRASRKTRDWFDTYEHTPREGSSVTISPPGYADGEAYSPALFASAFEGTLSENTKFDLVSLAGSQADGKLFRARLVESNSRESVVTDGDEDGNVRSRTVIDHDAVWMLRYRQDVTEQSVIVDERGNAWNVVSVEELDRRRTIQIGAARTVEI